MSAYQDHSHASGLKAPAANSALNLAGAVLAQTWHAAEDFYLRLQARDGVRQMLKLEDHLLRDMGLTRGDVERAANLPLGHSAGGALARIRRSRVSQ